MFNWFFGGLLNKVSSIKKNIIKQSLQKRAYRIKDKVEDVALSSTIERMKNYVTYKAQTNSNDILFDIRTFDNPKDETSGDYTTLNNLWQRLLETGVLNKVLIRRDDLLKNALFDRKENPLHFYTVYTRSQAWINYLLFTENAVNWPSSEYCYAARILLDANAITQTDLAQIYANAFIGGCKPIKLLDDPNISDDLKVAINTDLCAGVYQAVGEHSKDLTKQKDAIKDELKKAIVRLKIGTWHPMYWDYSGIPSFQEKWSEAAKAEKAMLSQIDKHNTMSEFGDPLKLDQDQVVRDLRKAMQSAVLRNYKNYIKNDSIAKWLLGDILKAYNTAINNLISIDDYQYNLSDSEERQEYDKLQAEIAKAQDAISTGRSEFIQERVEDMGVDDLCKYVGSVKKTYKTVEDIFKKLIAAYYPEYVYSKKKGKLVSMNENKKLQKLFMDVFKSSIGNTVRNGLSYNNLNVDAEGILEQGGLNIKLPDVNSIFKKQYSKIFNENKIKNPFTQLSGFLSEPELTLEQVKKYTEALRALSPFIDGFESKYRQTSHSSANASVQVNPCLENLHHLKDITTQKYDIILGKAETGANDPLIELIQQHNSIISTALGALGISTQVPKIIQDFPVEDKDNFVETYTKISGELDEKLREVVSAMGAGSKKTDKEVQIESVISAVNQCISLLDLYVDSLTKNGEGKYSVYMETLDYLINEGEKIEKIVRTEPDKKKADIKSIIKSAIKAGNSALNNSRENIVSKYNEAFNELHRAKDEALTNIDKSTLYSSEEKSAIKLIVDAEYVSKWDDLRTRVDRMFGTSEETRGQSASVLEIRYAAVTQCLVQVQALVFGINTYLTDITKLKPANAQKYTEDVNKLISELGEELKALGVSSPSFDGVTSDIACTLIDNFKNKIIYTIVERYRNEPSKSNTLLDNLFKWVEKAKMWLVNVQKFFVSKDRRSDIKTLQDLVDRKLYRLSGEAYISDYKFSYDPKLQDMSGLLNEVVKFFQRGRMGDIDSLVNFIDNKFIKLPKLYYRLGSLRHVKNQKKIESTRDEILHDINRIRHENSQFEKNNGSSINLPSQSLNGIKNSDILTVLCFANGYQDERFDAISPEGSDKYYRVYIDEANDEAGSTNDGNTDIEYAVDRNPLPEPTVCDPDLVLDKNYDYFIFDSQTNKAFKVNIQHGGNFTVDATPVSQKSIFPVSRTSFDEDTVDDIIKRIEETKLRSGNIRNKEYMLAYEDVESLKQMLYGIQKRLESKSFLNNSSIYYKLVNACEIVEYIEKIKDRFGLNYAFDDKTHKYTKQSEDLKKQADSISELAKEIGKNALISATKTIYSSEYSMAGRVQFAKKLLIAIQKHKAEEYLGYDETIDAVTDISKFIQDYIYHGSVDTSRGNAGSKSEYVYQYMLIVKQAIREYNDAKSPEDKERAYINAKTVIDLLESTNLLKDPAFVNNDDVRLLRQLVNNTAEKISANRTFGIRVFATENDKKGNATDKTGGLDDQNHDIEVASNEKTTPVLNKIWRLNDVVNSASSSVFSGDLQTDMVIEVIRRARELHNEKVELDNDQSITKVDKGDLNKSWGNLLAGLRSLFTNVNRTIKQVSYIQKYQEIIDSYYKWIKEFSAKIDDIMSSGHDNNLIFKYRNVECDGILYEDGEYIQKLYNDLVDCIPYFRGLKSSKLTIEHILNILSRLNTRIKETGGNAESSSTTHEVTSFDMRAVKDACVRLKNVWQKPFYINNKPQLPEDTSVLSDLDDNIRKFSSEFIIPYLDEINTIRVSEIINLVNGINADGVKDVPVRKTDVAKKAIDKIAFALFLEDRWGSDESFISKLKSELEANQANLSTCLSLFLESNYENIVSKETNTSIKLDKLGKDLEKLTFDSYIKQLRDKLQKEKEEKEKKGKELSTKNDSILSILDDNLDARMDAGVVQNKKKRRLQIYTNYLNGLAYDLATSIVKDMVADDALLNRTVKTEKDIGNLIPDLDVRSDEEKNKKDYAINELNSCWGALSTVIKNLNEKGASNDALGHIYQVASTSLYNPISGTGKDSIFSYVTNGATEKIKEIINKYTVTSFTPPDASDRYNVDIISDYKKLYAEFLDDTKEVLHFTRIARKSDSDTLKSATDILGKYLNRLNSSTVKFLSEDRFTNDDLLSETQLIELVRNVVDYVKSNTSIEIDESILKEIDTLKSTRNKYIMKHLVEPMRSEVEYNSTGNKLYNEDTDSFMKYIDFIVNRTQFIKEEYKSFCKFNTDAYDKLKEISRTLRDYNMSALTNDSIYSDISGYTKDLDSSDKQTDDKSLLNKYRYNAERIINTADGVISKLKAIISVAGEEDASTLKTGLNKIQPVIDGFKIVHEYEIGTLTGEYGNYISEINNKINEIDGWLNKLRSYILVVLLKKLRQEKRTHNISADAAFFHFCKRSVAFVTVFGKEVNPAKLEKDIETPLLGGVPAEDHVVTDTEKSGRKSMERDQGDSTSFSTKTLSKGLKLAYMKDKTFFDKLVNIVAASNPETGDSSAEVLRLLPNCGWVFEKALRMYNEKFPNKQKHRRSIQLCLENYGWPQLTKNNEFVKLLDSHNRGNI